MNDEDAFQAALDANPEDHTTRLVFADWLEERGDPRAEGYRALGVNRRRPKRESSGMRWFIWNEDAEEASGGNLLKQLPGFADWDNCLPRDWFLKTSQLGPSKANGNLWLGYVESRREVEDAVALAFSQLPPERRAELLAGTPEPKK